MELCKSCESMRSRFPTTPPLSHCLKFHPVGQGQFSSGIISNTEDSFRYVYDCGTVSKQKFLNEAINDLFGCEICKQATSLELDMVVISHFDEDHISGLKQLLMRFQVNTLLLPLTSLDQRLAAAFAKGVNVSGQYMRFLIDPVAYVNSLPHPPKCIILVPPSNIADLNKGKLTGDSGLSKDEPSNPADKKLPGGLSSTDLERIADNSPQSPRTLKVGGKLTLKNSLKKVFFEFIPYNDPSLYKSIDGPFLERVKLKQNYLIALSKQAKKYDICLGCFRKLSKYFAPQEIDHLSLIAGCLLCQMQTCIKELQTEYNKQFGKSKKNLISLFLYAGPTQAVSKVLYQVASQHPTPVTLQILPIAAFLTCKEKMVHYPLFPSPKVEPVELAVEKPSVLFTGDGYLDEPEKLELLHGYFENRLAKIGCLQVMHHGSQKNWCEEVTNLIKPELSVFCTNGQYNHPHGDVFRSFEKYSPVIVNTQVSVTFCSYSRTRKNRLKRR